MTQTIYSGNIAGISHAAPDFDDLNAEDQVLLVCEPHNQFDPKAIRVRHPKAGKLGYVPADATICIHDALRNQLTMTARIVGFNNEGKWLKIWLVVTIEL